MNKIIICLFSLLCLIACSKPEQYIDHDEYYVKYVFQYTKEDRVHIDIAQAVFVFTDEFLNEQTRLYAGTGTKDEIICGPFKKNDRVIASCVLSSSILYSYYIEIHISKNGSPFAFKTSGEIVDYLIDF